MFLKNIKKRAGFTITELMVSVGIIGIMSGIGVAKYQEIISTTYKTKNTFLYYEDQRRQRIECLAGKNPDDCRPYYEVTRVVNDVPRTTVWAGFPVMTGDVLSESQYKSAEYERFVYKYVLPYSNFSTIPPDNITRVCPNFDEAECKRLGLSFYDAATASSVCPDGWWVPSVSEVQDMVFAARAGEIPKDFLRASDGRYWGASALSFDRVNKTVSDELRIGGHGAYSHQLVRSGQYASSGGDGGIGGWRISTIFMNPWTPYGMHYGALGYFPTYCVKKTST